MTERESGEWRVVSGEKSEERFFTSRTPFRMTGAGMVPFLQDDEEEILAAQTPFKMTDRGEGAPTGKMPV
jgi:hypothetical protein